MLEEEVDDREVAACRVVEGIAVHFVVVVWVGAVFKEKLGHFQVTVVGGVAEGSLGNGEGLVEVGAVFEEEGDDFCSARFDGFLWGVSVRSVRSGEVTGDGPPWERCSLRGHLARFRIPEAPVCSQFAG